MKKAIHPAQLRAARALLDWSRPKLAAASGATVRTIARYEAAEGEPRDSTTDAIRKALEDAGVFFIDDDEGDLGPGVRLRRKAIV
ncbi:helix-turn-helix domain-containing protein [Azospirillum soli]|uniref:helix-turn-helix domain-containing protein n=1 Tax=Azospirillum soli TaxID=1304799 RepID=UPI001AE2DF6D|nr:helix-turn-helix transcriptional regulator [Azospirillum soli]MBP2310742.1 transcriptional regulator with XRE-family HTH domain [Azospirillum soli]